MPQLCAFTTPDGKEHRAVDLNSLLAGRESGLPACFKVVAENLARQVLAGQAASGALAEVTGWHGAAPPLSVALEVSRLVLPDSSGLPALMDLAAARDVASAAGVDPTLIAPQLPVTLVVDHSLIVDRAGHPNAMAYNLQEEYRRNAERYGFFKWAQQAFSNLQVVPPGAGIIHQIHLESIAKLVHEVEVPGHGRIVASEFVLGCDSHTPMVNGLGLLAWGVGGIEGEAAALGQRHVARIPRVVGVRLSGSLPAGSNTTDAVLTITERLRQVGVTGDFVEFFGPGVPALSVPDRATIANMAPEYGATIGYFPIDARTIEYLHQSGRAPAHVALVEAYSHATGLFVEDHAREADYSEVVEIDLSVISPSLAGPRRPQDRVEIQNVKSAFREALSRPAEQGGFGRSEPLALEGDLSDGSILIAAITSCTNTSNPAVMLGAGLLARNAVAKGLTVPRWVKTSLAPGSRLVDDYLARAGLMAPLEALGFHVVGHGCTTCSGKSGPLNLGVAEEVEARGLVGVAILSGNRNFEGRVHPLCRATYLASPPLVVAFAIAGRLDITPETEPLGHGSDGRPVFLRDIWPDEGEIAALLRDTQQPDRFQDCYAKLFDGQELWQSLSAPSGTRFAWDEGSTYIQRPPFFEIENPDLPNELEGARALVWAGDSLTTDHITPSGHIAEAGLAGRYLSAQGIAPKDFNTVTQRRGNHEFMARITFCNPRFRNLLAPESEGGMTRLALDETPRPIYEAAEALRAMGAPAFILAGRDYGMGSSRDWAAKGPKLLGVRAVLARGFERIHRTNLIGMGILPLVFPPEQSAQTLGLTGFERFTFHNLHAAVTQGSAVEVSVDGAPRFEAHPDIANEAERYLLSAGGMFAVMMKRLEVAA